MPGIRAGGQVEGSVDLHGTESDSADLTPGSFMVREGGSWACPGSPRGPPQKVSIPVVR